MADKAIDLVRTTKRRVKILEGWGWTSITVSYRYGPKGTGSARSFIEAKRGAHGVTLEYLYRLNNRYGSPVKFVGGFWDGGPIRSGKELDQLASPLKTTYNHRAGPTTNRGEMPTATTPRKRVAKKAAATNANGANGARKRAARRPETDVDEDEFMEEDEAPKKGRPRSEGPTKAEIAAQERAARKAEKASARDEDAATVAEMRAEEKSWDEISEELGKSVGLCVKLYYWHLAREEDGGEIPEPTTEDVVADREAGLSYPQIEVKYDITRQQVWSYLEEAGIDHFESDIGKGGRYVKRDPEIVEGRRQAAAEKRNANRPEGGRKRGRKPKFTGFTDETPDEDVLSATEGKKITWNKVRGEGTDSAIPKVGTLEITTDKRNKRGLKFSDGRKTRTVYVNNIVEIA